MSYTKTKEGESPNWDLPHNNDGGQTSKQRKPKDKRNSFTIQSCRIVKTLSQGGRQALLQFQAGAPVGGSHTGGRMYLEGELDWGCEAQGRGQLRTLTIPKVFLHIKNISNKGSQTTQSFSNKKNGFEKLPEKPVTGDD